MNSTTDKKDIKVCVSGASGYVASHIVADLLKHGYTVHGTVRTLGGKSSEHLTVENLCPDGATGELKLFSADLLTEGSFDEAIEGCTYVLHTASPFLTGKITDAKSQLIDPALKGTENVLNSATKSGTVKRVVLTSSVLAIYGDNCDKVGSPYNEDDWNTTSNESHGAYSYSKTLAEKRAWELEKEAPWDMVSINPGLVVGPTLSGRGNDGTFSVMKQLLSTPAAPNLAFGCVDVRDVAKAHRLAFEDTSASGRYLAVENTYNMIGLGKLIRESFPNYSTPKYTVPKTLFMLFGPLIGQSRQYIRNNVDHPAAFDNAKVKGLIGSFLPMTDSLKDTIESMIKFGLIKRK